MALYRLCGVDAMGSIEFEEGENESVNETLCTLKI
jgi:hypothetical protein